MSAFKIQHIPTGKYISTTFVKYWTLYLGNNPYYKIENALVKNGKVYSTKSGAERILKIANKIDNNFKIEELQ